jgi:hypothetical protein
MKIAIIAGLLAERNVNVNAGHFYRFSLSARGLRVVQTDSAQYHIIYSAQF